MEVKIFAICALLVVSSVHANGQENKIDDASASTLSSSLVNSLENISKKIQSIKARLDQTLNETATSELIKKTHHDSLIEKGYRFTADVGYHKLFLTKLTWHEALQFCRRKNAHLAVIDSAAEANALGEIVRDRLLSTTEVAHVGIHDYANTGSWIDIFFGDLRNADYLHWKQISENRKPNSGAQHCGAIDASGQLSDLPCSAKEAFICEAELDRALY